MNTASLTPRRIGILLEYPTLNGGEHSLLAVLDQLSKDRFTPILIAPAAGPLADACRARQLELIPFDLAQVWPDVDLMAENLRRITLDQRLDILHANSLSAGRKLGAIAGRIPCPTTSHLRDIMKLSGPAIAALNAHDRLIAVSHATRDFHVAQGLAAEKIVTIHNGIALDLFRPRPATSWLHRELGLSEECLLAGTVGQICLRKGQNDLAQAAVMLRDRLPQLHFLVIGQRHSGKAESIAFDEEITKVFADAGMESRLHRLGWRQDIHELYPELHLLIHPARQEPLGRVLLEAAACGTPIVATDVGGTTEILMHGESGWLVPAGNPQALAEGIEKLVNDPNLRQRLANSGRSTIVDRFSIEQATRFHEEFWTAVSTISVKSRSRPF